jgi:hypothetical protein
LPKLDNLGLEITERAKKISEQTSRQLWAVSDSVEAKIAALTDAVKNGSPVKREGLWGGNPNSSSLNGNAEPKDRWKLPELDPKDVYGLDLSDLPQHLQISIPSVHIFGFKDPRYPSGVQLAMFSSQDKRLTYDHEGGHEIPRDSRTSRDLASAVEWVEWQIKG